MSAQPNHAYAAARDRLVRAAARVTDAEAELQRFRYTEPAPISVWLVIAMTIWAALLAVALWLAAHDPDYLSRVVERVIGGAK